MRKRIVEAHLANGAVLSYRIGVRPARMRLTDEEYIGLAKQYHVEDGLHLVDVQKWVLHPLPDGKPPRFAE